MSLAEPDPNDGTPDGGSGFLRLIPLALLAGLVTGVVGSAFHAGLNGAQRLRGSALIWAQGSPALGLATILIMTALAAILARWLVIRFAPMAAGSGVQHVEAVVRGTAAPAGFAAIPVKFIGGILAIGSGLALGREGPTVQMGATIGSLCGARLLRSLGDRVAIHAACAGAGLAVAFNAPVGGCVFVFEELTKRVTPPLMAATLVATGAAVAVMRVISGDVLDLTIPSFGPASLRLLPSVLVLSVLVGLLGATYNALTLAILRITDRQHAIPWVVRTGGIGVVIGLLLWYAPDLAGGGEDLTRTVLSGDMDGNALVLILAVRFIVGPLSYAAGAPGGLFMPLLLVGAAFGAGFGEVVAGMPAAAALSPGDCAVVGMAGLFSAVVRAPLTGVVLVIEMTGRADLSLSILIGTIVAAVSAACTGNEPIYDSLGRRMLSAPVKQPVTKEGEAQRRFWSSKEGSARVRRSSGEGDRGA